MALISGKNALRTCSPIHGITASKQNLAYQASSLERAMNAKIQRCHGQLRLLEKSLADLNPQAILKRGYSITYHLPEEEIMKNASAATPEDQVMVVLGKGRLRCRVEESDV